MYALLKSNFKSPEFVLFGANLTNFDDKYDNPGFDSRMFLIFLIISLLKLVTIISTHNSDTGTFESIAFYYFLEEIN